MISLLERLWREEGGQTLVEYVFVVMLASLAVLIGLGLFGRRVNNRYSNIVDHVP